MVYTHSLNLIHRHDFKNESMLVFFTRVLTWRYTLHRKPTLASPKFVLLAKYWPHFWQPSVKNQNKSCFLPVRFDPKLTSHLENKRVMRPQWAYAQRRSSMRDTKCAIWREIGRGAQVWDHPIASAKANFTKLFTGKIAVFQMIRPIENCLF